MRLFDNLRLAVKLPIVMGTLALLSLLAMGYTSHRMAHKALMTSGEARIDTALKAKLLEFEAWFDVIESDLKSQAASPLTIRAMNDFSAAWDRLGPDPKTYLQNRFITDNPNLKSDRYKLVRLKDVSNYALAHSRYHSGFVSVFQEKSEGGPNSAPRAQTNPAGRHSRLQAPAQIDRSRLRPHSDRRPVPYHDTDQLASPAAQPSAGFRSAVRVPPTECIERSECASGAGWYIHGPVDRASEIVWANRAMWLT